MLDYFESIFCINLEHRPDRKQHALKEFEKIGIANRVEFINAVYLKDRPALGNHLSHAICINKANKRGINNVLIFEDDVLFLDNALDTLIKAEDQLSHIDKWGLFYLGANLEQPCYQETENLSRLTFAFSTHAYAINRYLFDLLISINLDDSIAHNDVHMSNYIIPHFPCYIATPITAIQSPSYSDIEKREVNYNWMIDRFNNNLVRK